MLPSTTSFVLPVHGLGPAGMEVSVQPSQSVAPLPTATLPVTVTVLMLNALKVAPGSSTRSPCIATVVPAATVQSPVTSKPAYVPLATFPDEHVGR